MFHRDFSCDRQVQGCAASTSIPTPPLFPSLPTFSPSSSVKSYLSCPLVCFSRFTRNCNRSTRTANRSTSFRHSVDLISNRRSHFLLTFDSSWEYPSTTYGPLSSSESESILQKSDLYEPVLFAYLLQHCVPTFVSDFSYSFQ